MINSAGDTCDQQIIDTSPFAIQAKPFETLYTVTWYLLF